MKALALILLVALPSASAEQERFDLICTYGQTPVRYRVDAAQGLACEGQCQRVWSMGAVTASELRLKDTPALYPDERPETITINRVTGKLTRWIGGSFRAYTEAASCEAAPFSGFPPRKF